MTPHGMKYEVGFYNLFGTRTLGLYQADAFGHYADVMGKEENRGGLTEADAVSWAIHPEDLDEVQARWEGAMESGQQWTDHFRYLSTDGMVSWIDATSRALRDSDGVVKGYLVCNLDVTERVLAQKELLLSEERQRIAAEAAKVGLWDLDAESGECYFSPNYSTLLGYAPEELPRRLDEWDQLVHDDDIETVRLGVGNCVNGMTSEIQLQFRLRNKQGKWIWFLCQGKAAAVDSTGEARRIVGTLIDITQSKREHEQVLADSDRLLHETQRIAQLGTYVLDLVNDTWSCSSILRDILGIEDGFPLNLLGHFEIVHPDFRKHFIDHYLACVMTSTVFEMEYKVVRHRDGIERWVAECSEVNVDAAGRATRMIGTIQDITDRKAAEEAIRNLNNDLDRRVMERTSQLASAKKEIESFSYSVSHDLRAPLRHINSYSTLLIEDHGKLLPAEGRYYLDRIRTASSRMGKLIDDLLTLTRVSRTSMKRESFDISQMAQDVANMLKEGETDCAASFVIQEGLRADGDSILVRLVLENLLGNSVKYASRRNRPVIEFGELPMAPQPAFFVRDDGVGFDMAYAENLFQPFQRLHGADFEGTGIGLATVKKIIERHGGNIWAEGKENEGATFYFTLSDASAS